MAPKPKIDDEPTSEQVLIGVLDRVLQRQDEGFAQLRRAMDAMSWRMTVSVILLVLATSAGQFLDLGVQVSSSGISWTSRTSPP